MNNKKDLHYQSATELVQALANREVSSTELLEETISRIERFDHQINSIVVRDFTNARIAAQAADVAIARGERRPLLGLPMTVKESFNVAGLVTSWGNSQYKNWRPSQDALVVARLKVAGAVVIGKTNVPFMLKDWQTYNELYGTTNNPWNLNLTPGGSSGGAAAALAAGFVALELGSDMAGSLRAPAHYCGIYAHRPSLNLIPLRGGGPPATPPLPDSSNDFVVAGPMARTADDLALALNILAGPDELSDAKAYKLALPQARHKNLSDYRVLVIGSHPFCPIDHATKTALNNLVNKLEKLDTVVSHDVTQLPSLEKIAKNYATLFSSFAAETLSVDVYQKIEAITRDLQKDDDSFKANFLRGFVLSHRNWLIATNTRKQLRQEWRQIYKKYDIVLSPVTPTAAFVHDHSPITDRKIKIDDVNIPYTIQHVWASIASLFGLPSTVAPIDRTEDGLPIGIQIIGDYLEDYTTIQFAGLLEREFGGFAITPEFNIK